jgi:hypothetical protein
VEGLSTGGNLARIFCREGCIDFIYDERCGSSAEEFGLPGYDKLDLGYAVTCLLQAAA